MRVILTGVKKYQLNEKEKKLIVDCESFEQVFTLEPPKEKERKSMTVRQLETLDRRKQAQEIFDYWNRTGCMKHKEFGQYVLFLQRKIKSVGYDNLVKMIDNFVSVYDPEQKEFYWTVKRNLKQVLSDDRWHPDNFRLDDYRVKGKESNREDDVRRLYENSGIEYWKE